MREQRDSLHSDSRVKGQLETTKPTLNNQTLFQAKKERKVLPETEVSPFVPPKSREKCNLRTSLVRLMYSRTMDFFILVVIAIFTVLTIISLALDCEGDSTFKSSIEIAVLVLLVFFMCEILLKWAGVGMKYLRSVWNVFDASIVILSFVLACMTVFDGSSKAGVLKYSVILRLLRLAVAFRKFNDVKRIKDYYIMKGITTKFSVNTKSERVIMVLSGMLQEPWMQTDHSLTENLQWCIDVIKSNKLQEAVLTVTGKDSNGLEEDLITIVNQYSTQNQVKSARLARRRSSRLVQTPSVAEVEKEEDLVVRQCLSSVDFLDFNIFTLKQITNNNELFTLMQLFFRKSSLIPALNIDPEKFKRFISKVQSGYNTTIPYHTATHAADVTQTMHYFVTTAGVGDIMQLSALELAGCYLAASVHDYEHPGLNNVFLVNTQSELAIRYNDKSVLENHHVSASFALTLGPDCDIYATFNAADFAAIRNQMIEMVLATDNLNHFSHISQLKNKFPAARDVVKEDKSLLFQILIHAADISNPGKPWEMCKRWTELVITEFWLQGDKERDLGLPLGYLMDRKTVNVAKSQIGFIDVIVFPTFEALKVQFPALQENCSQLLANKEEWGRRLDTLNGGIQIPDPEQL